MLGSHNGSERVCVGCHASHHSVATAAMSRHVLLSLGIFAHTPLPTSLPFLPPLLPASRGSCAWSLLTDSDGLVAGVLEFRELRPSSLPSARGTALLVSASPSAPFVDLQSDQLTHSRDEPGRVWDTRAPCSCAANISQKMSNPWVVWRELSVSCVS